MTRRPKISEGGPRVADRGALAPPAKTITVEVALKGVDVERLRYLRGLHPDETDAGIVRRALRAYAREK